MRIVLFCEEAVTIQVLLPLQEEIINRGTHQLIWYLKKEKVGEFTPPSGISYTYSMQELLHFKPELIFVPGDMVPFYLSGVKIRIFDSYNKDNRSHWLIHNFFDLYLTQGPFFTERFLKLRKQHGGFEVMQTGWSRQDWTHAHEHIFDIEREHILATHNKEKIVLYAPTPRTSISSLPHLVMGLRDFASEENVVLLIQLHPNTDIYLKNEFQALAENIPNALWIDDTNVVQYELMADVLISDTSSVIYEFLLLNKPVITYQTQAEDICWINIHKTNELHNAYKEAVREDKFELKRREIKTNFDPYTDGHSAARVLDAAINYADKFGIPAYREVNSWRQFEVIKRFGNYRPL